MISLERKLEICKEQMQCGDEMARLLVLMKSWAPVAGWEAFDPDAPFLRPEFPEPIARALDEAFEMYQTALAHFNEFEQMLGRITTDNPEYPYPVIGGLHWNVGYALSNTLNPMWEAIHLLAHQHEYVRMFPNGRPTPPLDQINLNELLFAARMAYPEATIDTRQCSEVTDEVQCAAQSLWFTERAVCIDHATTEEKEQNEVSMAAMRGEIGGPPEVGC